MKSSHSKNKRKIIITVGIGAFIILVIGFFARALIRERLLPSVAHVLYGSEVTKTAETELQNLGEPLRLLGYNLDSKNDTKCTRAFARGAAISISCVYSTEAYLEVPTDDAGKETLKKAAADIQKTLQKNGWTGIYDEVSEYSSLTKLVNETIKGIDYTPNATYWKGFGDVACSLGTSVAFQSPSKPALHSQFWCSHNLIEWFGDPGY